MTKELTPSGKDYAYSLVKGGLGAIPMVGSLATEIFSLIIAPPLERRKGEWMNEISAKLAELSDKYAVDLNSLKENELFLDTVLQATTYALKTSEREKIIAFQNAIINTAVGDSPDKTVTQIFLNQLDNLTVWHIKILKLIDHPKNWYQTFNRALPSYSMASLSTLFIHAFPELNDKNDLLEIIWNDLKNAGFHKSGDMNTTMTGDGIFANRSTNLGQQFIKFISEYKS
jgi:hypothetical protein